MKSRDRITLIKESMANFPRSDFLETGTKLFVTILGNDFSDSAYKKTFSAAEFLDQYDQGNYNEEKVKKDDDKFIKSIISNVHLSLIITKNDLKSLAKQEGTKWEGRDESLWSGFVFLVAEAKRERDYPRKADYERITRIINRRMNSPVVLLLCRPRSRKISLSLIDRRPNKKQQERDVIGDKVSMLYAVNCRKPQKAALERLNDLNVVSLIRNSKRPQDNRYFDAIVQKWHKIISIEKHTKEKTMKTKCNVEPRTIFCHDNLKVLRGINDECVDLIYLDPPFNKNKTFTAPIGTTASGASFKDTWGKEDLKDESVDQIKGEDNLKEYLDSVKNFSDISNYCYLVSMALRLLEMRRILKKGGSLYYHCDHTMSAYIKILLDCVFGVKQHQNEIVWCYEKPRPASKRFKQNFDTIYFYTKDGGQHYFLPQTVARSDGSFGKRTFKRPDGTIYKSKYEGKLLGNWWADIPSFATRMTAKERTKYPTQKPTALLERIIKASSKEKDLVLDPFCGCATTCIAAEKLGRQWIGIDISKKAYELVERRLAEEFPADMLRRAPSFKNTPPPKNHNRNTS